MSNWNDTQTRILREASDLKPLKVLITIIAAPFFAIGWLFGLIWVVLTLVWQAIWVGVSQAGSMTKRTKTSGSS